MCTHGQRNLGMPLGPLAGAVAGMLAICPPALEAKTIAVTRCDDHNAAGDLRHGISAALDGDNVDLTSLSCPDSRISLQLGELATSHDITLSGPGRTNLKITGKYYSSAGNTIQPSRVLNHTGTGTLTIRNLSLSKGYLTGTTVSGGCISSAGNVILDHADVYLCRAEGSGTGAFVSGGGVYARHALTLTYSSISANVARASSLAHAMGGGAFAVGNFHADHSTIERNYALAASGTEEADAGGLFLMGAVTIVASTISDNTADTGAGGMQMNAYPGNASIIDSTISGNTTTAGVCGGIFTAKASTTISNSTIAFNRASIELGLHGLYAPGLATVGFAKNASVTLYSTLIANNTFSGFEDDVSAVNGATTSVTITGADNLVRAASANMPAGTISGLCPLLGPLRENGGATRTHALLSTSPGIDAGNNAAGLAFDQRGSPFARVSGTFADIGAYEVQQDDIVFNASFEGCP